MNLSIKPLITIYIPTHNRCNLLKKAVKSIIKQTYKNFEIIIVDDASNDGTQEYCTELALKKSNIRYFRSDDPKGACYSRNVAIKNAKGEFITGLDDDDYFKKDRLKKFLLSYDDKFSFISSNYYFFNEKKLWHRKIRLKKVSINEILKKNYIGNQIFIKTSRLRSVNGFDEGLKACQDYDLWIRLIEKFGQSKIIPDKTYYINLSKNNPSITNSKNVYINYLSCYFKHISKRNHSQRSIQIMEINNYLNRKIKFNKLRILFMNGAKWHTTKYLIKRIISILKGN